MSSYLGRHAELYDLFYADKPYAEEAAFVDAVLREHAIAPPQRLLELACGTGRHALQLERRGYDIVATDYSADMLACARRHAEAASSHVAFHLADMRRIGECDAVRGIEFDAVYALFDSIGYVQTNEAIAEVLRGVRDALMPGGLFVFEFWHAAAMLREFDPLRVRRWTTDEGEVVRISRTTLDVPRQLSHVAYEITELRRDGTYSRIEEMQTNRYFLVQEMAAFVAAAGLDAVAWFAGFSRDSAIDERTWHVVAVARRPTSEASAER
jgi:SAM-dependent methyltransferase